ncbi:GntR family transcriptional regulator [Leifsonia kafniensis]|uniref:GntR family transcriptional regulator n=1 Tax=Leifsonia kafniensis TaxID=475957 RepID=A0ABP7KPB3_9MICO
MTSLHPSTARRAVRPSDTSVRYQKIAEDLEVKIRAGVYPVGRALPAEDSLACEYAVARGTIRRALATLNSDGTLIVRRGSRWVVRSAPMPRDLTVLRSFGQWAMATGQAFSARTVSLKRGRADATESRELGVRLSSPVLRMVRVESIDGRPIMIKRTTFPERLIAVVEAVPADARSLMEVIGRTVGLALASGENRIGAMLANAADRRLLELDGPEPLLQLVRSAHDSTGRAFELSDDRYLADSVNFTLMNSVEGRSARIG